METVMKRETKNRDLKDLPGYGFAKVSKKQRGSWDIMIRTYLLNRETLQCLFLLIDSRISPQAIDLDFISWLGKSEIPFVIGFTKADKYPSREVKMNIEAFKTEMRKTWQTLPDIFITSSTKKTGGEELIQFIGNVLNK